MREAVIIYSKHESYLCTLHQIKNGKQNLFYLHDASDLLIILFECVEWRSVEPSKHCSKTDRQVNRRNFILIFYEIMCFDIRLLNQLHWYQILKI